MVRRIMTGLLAALLVVFGSGVAFAEDAEEIDYHAPYSEEYTQKIDSAFTFAFVGDTQIVTYKAPEKLDTIYQWILDNKEQKNIRFVAGLGDITDKSEPFEWDAAIQAIRKMDGILPYSLIRGNHDTSVSFLQYVNYESYTAQAEGMFDGVLNTYQTLSVGTLKYLFLNLDHGPSDDVLDWACGVVEAHPKHNVIITTHGYINNKGELLSPYVSVESAPSKTSGRNNGPDIWDQLVKKYENIIMVVCGHIGTAPEIVNYEAVGDHGNKIQHVLVNPQRLDRYDALSGMVALFHFSEDGTQVQVENYATLQQDHYGPGVQFQVNSMGGNANQTPIPWPVVIGCTVGALVIAAGILLLLRKKRQCVTENTI